MGRRLCLLVATAVLASACAGGSATAAQAALSAPVPGGVLLAFGDAYAVSGRQLTHGGIDLEAGAGAAVLAAASGQVTFAGSVPADGGGRVMAVTIQTPDALKVTVSPLASVRVAAGEAVTAGDDIGMLSDSGDASVAQSHVHLSVRTGERYIDPAPMLGAAAAMSDGANAGTGSALEETDAGATGAPAGHAGPAAASAGSGSVSIGNAIGAASTPAVDGGAIGEAAVTRAADDAAAQRQLASTRARVGNAYCGAITHMRGSTLSPARPVAAVSGRATQTSGGSMPSAPVIPVGPMLGGVAFVGMGGVVLARIRRQYASEVA